MTSIHRNGIVPVGGEYLWNLWKRISLFPFNLKFSPKLYDFIRYMRVTCIAWSQLVDNLLQVDDSGNRLSKHLPFSWANHVLNRLQYLRSHCLWDRALLYDFASLPWRIQPQVHNYHTLHNLVKTDLHTAHKRQDRSRLFHIGDHDLVVVVVTMSRWLM